MRAVCILIVLVGVTCANPIETKHFSDSPVFGYIGKYGIPEADRIRKAEEQYSNKGWRIVGGVPAALGQYPYKAGLISDIMGISSRGVCGGSIISAQRILTAAHCWNDGRYQAWRQEVVVGSVFLFSGGIRVHSSICVTHPSWSPTLARNDIAVIYLSEPLLLSGIISPIALPSGIEVHQDFNGVQAVSAGYGITTDEGAITADQSLNHVRLNVISNGWCSVGFPLIIKSSNICTSGIGGSSTCTGDTGGPLVYNSNGRDILIGVSSFISARGCSNTLPAVFTRVTYFLDFIHQHI